MALFLGVIPPVPGMAEVGRGPMTGSQGRAILSMARIIMVGLSKEVAFLQQPEE